jgi:hypothetical protein
MSFTPNMPGSGKSLGQTRSQVLDNFAILRSTIAVNHIDVNDANAGKHKFVQVKNQVALPAGLINGFETIYSKAVVSGELFFTRGNTGVEIRMTAAGNLTNGAPQATANGATFLPGGLLLQWGRATTTGSTTSVTFPAAFQALSTPYSIVLTVERNVNNVDVAYVEPGTPNNTSFTIRRTFSSNLVVNWMAIGLA